MKTLSRIAALLALLCIGSSALATTPTTIGSKRGIYFQTIFPGTVQTVAYTGTAGTSAAFQTATQVVQLTCTTACFVLMGASPVATSSNGAYLAAGVPYFFGVKTSGWKVSAVQSAAGGNLYVTEGSL